MRFGRIRIVKWREMKGLRIDPCFLAEDADAVPCAYHLSYLFSDL